jgi:Flp pilus assembly protein TadG
MSVARNPREQGASLVEAALVIPLLLMFLAVVVDLGRVYFAYVTMIDCAREGARYGSKNPSKSNGEICAVALAEAVDQPVTGLNCQVATTRARGSPVRVTVSIDNFHLIFGGLLGLPDPDLSYNVAFRIRCEYGDGC